MPMIQAYPKPFSPFYALTPSSIFHPTSSFSSYSSQIHDSISNFPLICISSSPVHPNLTRKRLPLYPVSATSEPKKDTNPKPKTRKRQPKTQIPDDPVENSGEIYPTTKPRKPRRGRRSEAAAVEDFVRDSLERTFVSIRQQNSEAFEGKKVLKDRVDDDDDDDDDEDEDDRDEEEDDGVRGKKVVVEEENPDWPLDADVGWGIRASEYFDKHPIRNVVGEDGVLIDWEGETDDNWVKEINCLEWETFAFHPSPLIVLVFERYNR